MNEDFTVLESAALKIADIYDQKGYQVVYAIHDPRKSKLGSINKGIHIHYIINSYGIRGGRRFSETPNEFCLRKKRCNQIVEECYCRELVKPLYIINANNSNNDSSTDNMREKEICSNSEYGKEKKSIHYVPRLESPIYFLTKPESPIYFLNDGVEGNNGDRFR